MKTIEYFLEGSGETMYVGEAVAIRAIYKSLRRHGRLCARRNRYSALTPSHCDHAKFVYYRVYGLVIDQSGKYQIVNTSTAWRLMTSAGTEG